MHPASGEKLWNLICMVHLASGLGGVMVVANWGAVKGAARGQFYEGSMQGLLNIHA